MTHNIPPEYGLTPNRKCKDLFKEYLEVNYGLAPEIE